MKPSDQNTSKPDGRAQRTIRSRTAIVEALLSLYETGNLVPTAQQVADHSGLGIRTVFRHFSEMERLAIEGDELLHQRYHQLPVVQPLGGVTERIEQLVKDRAFTCEMFAPYIRSTLAQTWRYEQLEKNYRKLCSQFRKQLLRFLPELTDQPEEIIEAADIALSFETWDRLRQCRRMGKKPTTRVMITLLTSVLSDAGIVN